MKCSREVLKYSARARQSVDNDQLIARNGLPDLERTQHSLTLSSVFAGFLK